MKAMIDAIRKKRFSGSEEPQGQMGRGAPAEESESGGNDLHAFVSGLSDDEKMELQDILSSDKSLDIEKGEPSSEERGKIEQSMKRENAENAAEQADDDDRFQMDDDLAGEMVDRTAIRQAEQGLKPRNITERVNMYAAKQLKGKGKL